MLSKGMESCIHRSVLAEQSGLQKCPAKECCSRQPLLPSSPSLPCYFHFSYLVGNAHGVKAKVSGKASIQLSGSLEEGEGLGLGHRHHAAGTGGLCVGERKGKEMRKSR